MKKGKKHLLGLRLIGGLVTGILAEISPFSYNQIGHLEILWIGWSPFFFIAAATLLQHGRKRDFLMMLALAENFSIPLRISRSPLWENLGSEHRWLATQPRQVVIELPIPSEQKYLETRVGYMYRSIFHWQPKINGYGDYTRVVRIFR